jgi:hypothetical protein
MNMRTIVAIPTLGESPWLEPMTADLLNDSGVDAIWLLDNTKDGSFAPLVGRVLRIHSWRKNRRLHAHKVSGSVYRLWNLAITQARLAYPPSDRIALCILNDDLELPPEGCGQLGRRLIEGDWAMLGFGYGELPDQIEWEVSGTFRHGGLGGFAFAVDPHRVETVPDCYNWWFGDDHLVNATRRNGGRVGVCGNIRVVHHTSTTGNAHWDRLAPLVAADRVAYAERWGDT